MHVSHSTPWNLAVLLLVVYPFLAVFLAFACRRRGGSLLAVAFPAALPPLFVALALSWSEHARVLQAVVSSGRHAPGMWAIATMEALQPLRLGAFIAAAIVLILILWRAIRPRDHGTPVSRRWLSVPLLVLALLLIVEDLQYAVNRKTALPPNLFVAWDLLSLARGLSIAGALLSLVWLWHAARTGEAGVKMGWPGALTLLATLIVMASGLVEYWL